MGRAPGRVGCYDKALELLSARPHFVSELENKLRRRGYPREEIDAALGRLEELGHLNDRQTARELVTSRLRRGGTGARRLFAELRRRGAPSEAAEQAVRELVPRDELPQARLAAERWRRIGGRRPAGIDALARHLERRGFSASVIRSLLRELKAEPGADRREDPDSVS